MIISKKSQLGLQLNDLDVKRFFMLIEKEHHEQQLEDIGIKIDRIKASGDADAAVKDFSEEELYRIGIHVKDDETQERVRNIISDSWFKFDKKNLDPSIGVGGRIYLITNGVIDPSKKINTANFTGRALKDVVFGSHTYLLGKDKAVRFICGVGAIKGYYFDKTKSVLFEFGCDIDGGGYYFPKEYTDEFTHIMQLMTFIELGDIEVITLDCGRNNGKTKKSGQKIQNSSKYTVFVVDSTWNQMIIRTEGFGVMGHFRMQPCGKENQDRKLIWINAFEKKGYIRKPKAEIINSTN